MGRQILRTVGYVYKNYAQRSLGKLSSNVLQREAIRGRMKFYSDQAHRVNNLLSAVSSTTRLYVHLQTRLVCVLFFASSGGCCCWLWLLWAGGHCCWLLSRAVVDFVGVLVLQLVVVVMVVVPAFSLNLCRICISRYVGSIRMCVSMARCFFTFSSLKPFSGPPR